MRGLLYYLFTEGLAGEKGLESDHLDARIVACWDGHPQDLEPLVGPTGHRDFTELAGRLIEPVAALGYSREELRRIKPVYHLTIAAAKDRDTGAPVDRTLSDAEWADIAQECGNEGRSTGPHLHFEVRPGDRPVDPVAFYAAHGADLT